MEEGGWLKERQGRPIDPLDSKILCCPDRVQNGPKPCYCLYLEATATHTELVLKVIGGLRVNLSINQRHGSDYLVRSVPEERRSAALAPTMSRR